MRKNYIFLRGNLIVLGLVLLAVGITTNVTAQLPQSNSIIGHWGLDGDGSDIYNLNNGTETDDLEYDFNDFKFGVASGLFLSNIDKVTSIALPTNIAEKDIQTISCWFKLNGDIIDPAQDLRLFGKSNEIKDIYLRVVSPNASDGHPGSAKAQWLRQNSAYTSDNVIENDKWYHLAATIIYDGEKAIQSHIYINGELADKGSGTWDGEAGAPTDSDSDSPVYIGGTATGGNAFPGLIDAVTIWKTPLNSNEIKEIYDYENTLAFTTDYLETGMVDIEYFSQVSSTGIGTFSLDNDVPSWLKIDERTGTLSGTPTEASNVDVTVTLSNGAQTDVVTDFTLIISPAVGINSNIFEAVNIYPNPAKDVLNITNAYGFQLTIFDVTGKELFSQVVNSDNASVNTSELQVGIYFLTLNNGINFKSIKVVIE